MQVAADRQAVTPTETRLQVLQPTLQELARQARQLDLSLEQLVEALTPLMNEAALSKDRNE
ncbi:hypothetical protein D3C72_2571820 [compost metagenome]